MSRTMDEDDDDDLDQERDYDAMYARVEAILGSADLDFGAAVDILLTHLQANLSLPCEVKGIEDFNWEEPYVLGGWSPAEYERLKKTQPSYEDRYHLIRIDRGNCSKWMLFDDDICAHVRRLSDGKKFILALAELEATDNRSRNHQLLDDYSVWFVNSR